MKDFISGLTEYQKSFSEKNKIASETWLTKTMSSNDSLLMNNNSYVNIKQNAKSFSQRLLDSLSTYYYYSYWNDIFDDFFYHFGLVSEIVNCIVKQINNDPKRSIAIAQYIANRINYHVYEKGHLTKDQHHHLMNLYDLLIYETKKIQRKNNGGNPGPSSVSNTLECIGIILNAAPDKMIANIGDYVKLKSQYLRETALAKDNGNKKNN